MPCTEGIAWSEAWVLSSCRSLLVHFRESVSVSHVASISPSEAKPAQQPCDGHNLHSQKQTRTQTRDDTVASPQFIECAQKAQRIRRKGASCELPAPVTASQVDTYDGTLDLNSA